MKLDMTGTVALVRGADGPWGAAIAERLAACGAQLPTGARPGGERLDVLVNADPALTAGEADAPMAAAGAAIASAEAAAAVMETGRIVNIGSIYGLVPAHGREALAAASAALFAQTRALAMRLAPRGILVNAVALLGDGRPHTPLRRAARPEEVANAVLFLLASGSAYVAGEILRVDGGWSCGFAREF